MKKTLGHHIDEKLFHAFKLECTKNKISMTSILNDLIDKWVKENQKKTKGSMIS